MPRQIKEPMMGLETFKTLIRSFFPTVQFVTTEDTVECYVGDDWLHTLYWKNGQAIFAISEVSLSEKSVVKYLKKVKRTNRMYDSTKVALPLDCYGKRNVWNMQHILLG